LAGQEQADCVEEAGKSYLVYDGECPVCNAYVRFVRLKESIGSVELVDARGGGAIVDRIVSEGLDLDEGMVLSYGGRYYHGSDCVHVLAMLSSSSGVFNRLNALLFRSPSVARFMSPILRFGRNSLLRILGKRKLDLQVP
jgi:predicted DCC family thiol-disulfide oxidoreductase YuxK